ncbi:MAG TPA: ATPase, T2SS/T4P/T4SS family [Burkholderiales bacterium]|nr:ATPase, T2SS/T4P/T4SS family [Burkholderiales bacterium]
MNADFGGNLTPQDIITPEDMEAALEAHKATPFPKLGAALLQENLITVKQLNLALQKQTQEFNVPLGQVFVGMGVVTEETIRRVLSKKLHIPGVNFREFQPDWNVINFFSSKMIRMHRAVPLYCTESRIIVAMEDPFARDSLEALEASVLLKVDPLLASSEDIDFMIERFYSAQAEMSDDVHDEAGSSNVNVIGGLSGNFEGAFNQELTKILLDAIQQGATEIHLESAKSGGVGRVRFRKSFSMATYAELSADACGDLTRRIKTVSGLDASEQQPPNAGKFILQIDGAENVELRAIVVPISDNLDDVVIQLSPAPQLISLDTLGLQLPALAALKSLTAKPHGLLLFCGPACSGKTTTLHSLLAYMNKPDRKIWTVEDPVEIVQDGLRQVPIHAEHGQTSATMLRSLLSVQPSVFMVGETNEYETARAVLDASLNGHLVLAAVRANGAAECVERLLDFGVDAFGLGDAILGVVGQRLIRRLCDACRTHRIASEEELHMLAREYCADTHLNHSEVLTRWRTQYAAQDGAIKLFSATGCAQCDGVGLRGWIGLYELLVASAALKRKIHLRASVQEIFEAAIVEGMQTTKQDGIEKVLQGHCDWTHVQSALA